MLERTDQSQSQPTPVADDAQATTAQLQDRARTEYAQTQAHQAHLDHEDRIHPYDTQ